MTRMEFIVELTAAIRDLSKRDIARLLDYYGEMIDERIEEGMSESEAVAALGSVNDIAAQIMQEIPRERNTRESEPHALRAFAGKKAEADATHGRHSVSEPFNGLDVRADMADVRVLCSGDGETRIETEHDENVEETVEIRDGILTVDLSEPRRQRMGIGVFLDTFGGFFTNGKVTVYLSDKAWDSVCITTISGDVEVQDVKARTVTISTKTGEVAARHLVVKESIEAASLSGDVQLESIDAGEVSMRSLSGDLELNDLRAGNISVRGKSGDIEIEDTAAGGQIDAETISGDIVLHRSDAQELRLVSTSGDVSGTLLSPKEFSAHSVVGDVRVPESRNGAGRCDARTTTGDVTIRIVP